MNPVSRTLLKVVLPEGENVHLVKKGPPDQKQNRSTADLPNASWGGSRNNV